MSDIDHDNALKLATMLAGSVKGLTLYPAGHPAGLTPLQELFRALETMLRAQREIKVGVVDGVFFLEEHLFFSPPTGIDDLGRRFTEKEITGLVFTSGLQLEGLKVLVVLLGRSDIKASDIIKEISSAGVVGIKIQTEADEEPDEDTQEGACLKTYNQALTAVTQVFSDVETGRIPSSGAIISAVREMASLAIEDSATVLALSMIKDYDNYTFNHSVNVGVISMALGCYLGFSREEVETLGMAGFLHDVGKIRVEKSILNKPGKLTSLEFEEMKKHTESGTEIISKMKGINPKVAQAVLGHHIGFNRQGYPEWAREMDFSSMSEVVAVADSYDAITTVRVYRRQLNPTEAVVELQRIAGSYLNKDLVEKFREMMGPYPVGTVVRLDNNEIAVVCRPNLERPDGPTVKVVIDSAGDRLASPLRQRLVDRDGKRYATVVGVVDPLVKNIDIAACLNTSEAGTLQKGKDGLRDAQMGQG